VAAKISLSPPSHPIISGMNKPDYVLGGETRCGDCGKPVKVGVRGVTACKNPQCLRNKPAMGKPS
jgi:hypothetical protein